MASHDVTRFYIVNFDLVLQYIEAIVPENTNIANSTIQKANAFGYTVSATDLDP